MAISFAACGARSDLASGLASATTSGAGGSAACGPEGAACASDADCCDLPCAGGACTRPPPPCLNDVTPVQLITGLSDPYSLAGDATSLFVGQLEDGPDLLKLPKAGGSATALVEMVPFVEHMVVDGNQVFYTDEGRVRSVPTAGGTVSTLANVFGPAGLAVTPSQVYVAGYFANDLVQIDRTTLGTKVLASGLSGVYRVAATDDAVYFSSHLDGLGRYRLSTGAVDMLAPSLSSPRAVLAHQGWVYFTVPKTNTVHRLPPGGDEPAMFADLSSLSKFPEALQTDGEYLYLTLLAGGVGHIVRLPIAGGEPEVIVEDAGKSPSALVVDEGCVYWTEREGGSVFRARKAP